MTAPLIGRCWPLFAHAAHRPHHHAHRIVGHAHHVRHIRHARRIVGWACVATIGGGLGAAIVPPLLLVPSATPRVERPAFGPAGSVYPGLFAGNAGAFEFFPPEALSPESPEQAVTTGGSNSLTGGSSGFTESPQAVPEPSSLSLLAAAVAALAAWRARA